MLIHKLGKTVAIVLLAGVTCDTAHAQNRKHLVVEAGNVLREIMAIPVKGIPRALLAESQGLVIVPGMIRGGFVIGVKHGRGIAVARDERGAWTNPVFITITGGNVGFQAGLQSTDLILVFRNRTQIEDMMRGRFTIGANAGIAAGPIGRGMTAATDAQLRAQILSYSRSRGIFGGVSIDGSVIQPDSAATAAFYGQTAASPQGRVPPAANEFLRILNSFTNTPVDTPIAVPHKNHEVVCRQLEAAHRAYSQSWIPRGNNTWHFLPR